MDMTLSVYVEIQSSLAFRIVHKGHIQTKRYLLSGVFCNKNSRQKLKWVFFCFSLHGETPTKFDLSSHNKISNNKVGISSPEQTLMTSPWELLSRQKPLFFISFCFTSKSWNLVEVAFNDLSDGFIWFRRWALINLWHYGPRAHLSHHEKPGQIT